jgi:zinc protease
MKFKTLILTFFVTTLLLFSQPIKNSPELLTGELENGLKYYILENKKPEKRASLHLVYGVGSTSENDNQQGIAHFLEHMAFNGTKNYPKNDLIKYLQSIGLSFGGDLNAHTSFNETVYKLKIPTNSKEDIEQGFKIFNEWSHKITNNFQDVEDEKNIILEEWRTSQGLSERIGLKKRKAIFGSSRYFERLPIGKVKIIENTNAKIINDFYNTWYQPKITGIVAVGDFDNLEIEKYIKKYFSSLKNSKNFTPPQKYKIGEIQDSYTIFRDKELTNSTFEITTLGQQTPINTTKKSQKELETILFENIMNSRFESASLASNYPLFSAQMYSYQITDSEKIIGLSSSLKETHILDGISEIFKSIKIFAKYGPSDFEINQEIKEILSSLKIQSNNQSSITHESFMDELKDLYLHGDVFLNATEKEILIKKLVTDINKDNIKKLATDFYNSNSSKFLSYPEKASLPVFSDMDIKIIENKIKKSDFSNLKENSTFKLNPIILKPGKILSKEIKKDHISYLLSNGIKVKYKETAFEKDKIYINLFKEEGSSNDSYTEYLNTLFMSSLMTNSGIGNLSSSETISFMKGKNFAFSPYISDYQYGASLSSDKESLNIGIDSFFTVLLHPNFDGEQFKNTLDINQQQIINRKDTPNFIYKKELLTLLTNSHPRRMPFSLDSLKKVNESSIKALYKKKFSNYDNFNLIITGSINEKEVEALLVNKISALPVTKDKKTNIIKSLNVVAPKGKTIKTISKGDDEKATVTIIYPYFSPYNFNDKKILDGFSNILDILLLEVIREKLGGVYSISSSNNFSYNNHGENYLTIRFSTNPENVEKISQKVKETLEIAFNGEYSKDKINNILNNYKLSYENSIKKNNFWYSYLHSSFFPINDFKIITPEYYKELLTTSNLVSTPKKYINLENFLEMRLLPEKFKK